MCGRFNLRTKLNKLLQQFALDTMYTDASEPGNRIFEPRYNIAPSQDVLAVRLMEGKRELYKLRWGLIPSWAKDAKIAYSTINARADTVATKPAFRSAYKKRRCLIPTDGYYEWLRVGKEKQPYLYEVDGGELFAFAGLWESWNDPQGETVESFTIITTDANELAKKVHDRMPVIIDPDDYGEWLACEEIPLIPFPPERMTCRPVSTYVNNARNEGPQCTEPVQSS